MPLKLYLNDKLISNDPAECDWTTDLPEAYVELDERPELHLYNLGAHVQSFPKHKYGTGGEIVSKQQLRVNFARNLVQSDCPVWRKLLPVVNQQAKDKNTHAKSLDDAQRWRLAQQAKRGDLEWRDLYGIPLFTAVTGRNYKLGEVDNIRNTVSVAPKGNRLGDKLHRQGLAFVLAQETLDRFSLAAMPELIALIRELAKPAGYDHIWQDLLYVPFEQLTKGMDSTYEIIDEKELRPTEKVWLSLIGVAKTYGIMANEKNDGRWARYLDAARPCNRRTVIGLSKGADGWTDARTYVAINRKFLAEQKLDITGFLEVGVLMLHEYCHQSPDMTDHDHDQAFYELFHDSTRTWLPFFVDKCMTQLPSVLERHQKKLTRQQLRERDRTVQGQRRTEEFEKIAARS
jgi:hypothetical protein